MDIPSANALEPSAPNTAIYGAGVGEGVGVGGVVGEETGVGEAARSGEPTPQPNSRKHMASDTSAAAMRRKLRICFIICLAGSIRFSIACAAGF